MKQRIKEFISNVTVLSLGLVGLLTIITILSPIAFLWLKLEAAIYNFIF